MFERNTRARVLRQAGRMPVRHRLAPLVQAKLKSSSPGDRYEQEADRVSHQVMGMSDLLPSHACACGGACPRCKVDRRSQESPPSRSESRLVTGETRVPRVVDEGLRSHGESLDGRTRRFFEARFGRDFSSARIHTDDQATAAARSINARAFTIGNDIVFDRVEYSPDTSAGQLLLAHELVHVIQQSGARALASVPSHEPRTSPQVSQPSPPMVARGEKWDAFWDVGPLDALKAKELADKALAAAKRTGLPGLHNGPGDAWRHCYWNCLMTGELGRDQAKSIADNHEKHGGGPAIENLMDTRNNWEGRECGGSDCDPCCQKKLDTGVLDVIEGGQLVPSKKTPRNAGKQSDKYTY